jgi:hypothetical protein
MKAPSPYVGSQYQQAHQQVFASFWLIASVVFVPHNIFVIMQAMVQRSHMLEAVARWVSCVQWSMHAVDDAKQHLHLALQDTLARQSIAWIWSLG